MEFSRQEYWSGLPFPSPGDILNPGIEPTSLASPSLAGKLFATVPQDLLFVFLKEQLFIFTEITKAEQLNYKYNMWWFSH